MPLSRRWKGVRTWIHAVLPEGYPDSLRYSRCCVFEKLVLDINHPASARSRTMGTLWYMTYALEMGSCSIDVAYNLCCDCRSQVIYDARAVSDHMRSHLLLEEDHPALEKRSLITIYWNALVISRKANYARGVSESR